MALLTCVVGIANAMLMSVTERYREIGTMKCLGAVDGLVVKLFLIESGFMGVIGGVLGIILGFIVALIASALQYGSYGLSHFPLAGSGVVIFWAVIFGVLLSVLGAAGPAWQASRMKPVDALRVDE
jgi:ABC-type antimicrobial peptide transport system permease subunit